MGIFKNKNKKQLIFEFVEDEKGIMVTTKVNGKLTYNDVLCAKKVIDERIKDVKNRRK